MPKGLSMKYYSKIYDINNLYCTKKQIDFRINQIMEFSKKFNHIPEIIYTYTTDNQLHYRQHYIKQQQIPQNKQPYLLDLATTLEEFEKANFVHGDIVFKNIRFDGSTFKIIDFEPCIYQKRNGYKVLLFTPPYISKKDLENNTLTTSSDKIAFFFFIMRIRGILSSELLIHIHKKRILLQENILPISEEYFCSFSYEKIIHYCYKKNKQTWESLLN